MNVLLKNYLLLRYTPPVKATSVIPESSQIRADAIRWVNKDRRYFLCKFLLSGSLLSLTERISPNMDMITGRGLIIQKGVR